MLRAPVPILRMFDEDKARAFYIDYLGFVPFFEHRFFDDAPLYMGLAKDNCVIHLSEHHGDATPGSAIRIETDDIDAFHAALPEYKYARPGIMDQDWGCREVIITDPFGNRLVFFQDTPAVPRNRP
ncbi:hypothetical protein BFP76_02865 [Amylibacter kogurei]|uniref:Bleomycin resistance protein n=1 Tax=Paramylibacter kogurei TaxID=1889778 RepID=A0A2G5K3S7_9RHOB|nr:glyoxalase superfamily protein [Amylibacter kogurei]PIB24188.1 hypothetical protein BFP76_02865 [Amylibacter kogurei]